MSNINTAKKKLAGSVFNDAGGETSEHLYSDFYVTFAKASDDSMAADATANTKFWVNPFETPVHVVGAKYSAGGTIAAHDTNFATLQIKADDGAAGTPAVCYAISTTTTDSGNVVAHVAETLTKQSTWIPCAVGGNLWYAITKGGSGVVFRAGTATVRLRKVAA